MRWEGWSLISGDIAPCHGDQSPRQSRYKYKYTACPHNTQFTKLYQHLPAITEAYRFLELQFNLQSNGSPRLDLEAARATTAFVLFRFLDCGHRDTLCVQSSVRVSYCPAFTRSPPPAVVTGHCSHPGHRGRGTRNLKWTGSCTIVNWEASGFLRRCSL